MTQPSQPPEPLAARATPSWLGLFEPVAFTAEEEAALDAAWASPEVQAAVESGPSRDVDEGTASVSKALELPWDEWILTLPEAWRP